MEGMGLNVNTILCQRLFQSACQCAQSHLFVRSGHCTVCSMSSLLSAETLTYSSMVLAGQSTGSSSNAGEKNPAITLPCLDCLLRYLGTKFTPSASFCTASTSRAAKSADLNGRNSTMSVTVFNVNCLKDKASLSPSDLHVPRLCVFGEWRSGVEGPFHHFAHQGIARSAQRRWMTCKHSLSCSCSLSLPRRRENSQLFLQGVGLWLQGRWICEGHVRILLPTRSSRCHQFFLLGSFSYR